MPVDSLRSGHDSMVDAVDGIPQSRLFARPEQPASGLHGALRRIARPFGLTGSGDGPKDRGSGLGKRLRRSSSGLFGLSQQSASPDKREETWESPAKRLRKRASTLFTRSPPSPGLAERMESVGLDDARHPPRVRPPSWEHPANRHLAPSRSFAESLGDDPLMESEAVGSRQSALVPPCPLDGPSPRRPSTPPRRPRRRQQRQRPMPLTGCAAATDADAAALWDEVLSGTERGRPRYRRWRERVDAWDDVRSPAYRSYLGGMLAYAEDSGPE